MIEQPAEDGLVAVAVRERAALLRFLSARRVPVNEAEDLLQDLYVKLRSKATGPVSTPKAYLYRMLDNMLLDARRAHVRRHAREEAWTRHAFAQGEADDRPAADAAIGSRDEIRMVAEALSVLPQRTRAMFYRVRVDGASRKLVAEEFGISVSALEKHLQRAYEIVGTTRARLTEDLEDPRRHGLGRQDRAT